MTHRLVLRAVMKALYLFFIFNVIYGLINPVQQGRLPSLYNVLFPGRVRFIDDYEFDAYRLVDDHVIAKAQHETFNIVVLGSSEMWGIHSMPEQTVPVLLDGLGLVAADGRPVHVYNLGYSFSYAFKDLLVMDVILRREIPVDLVVVSILDPTLSYYNSFHPIVHKNFNLEMDVIEHYGLSTAYHYVDKSMAGRSIPVFLQLWEDRSALQTWLQMQMRGLDWSIRRMEFANVSDDVLTSTTRLEFMYEILVLNRLDPPLSTDFTQAFKQMSREYDLPVILLASPVPVEKNDLAPWLQTQAEMTGLPLIDCWNVFRDPTLFEDFYHIRREIHGPYADRIAAALSDPRLARKNAGLPLHLPPDFVPPSELCTVYP